MKRLMRSVLLPLVATCSLSAWANNIQVSNVTLTGQNTTNNTWQVKFDVSWNNSWRTSTLESNWDAAWIFIKFRFPPGYTYQHAVLNAAGHVNPAGSTLAVPTDQRGAFIFRSANGTGNVNYTNVELQWNYGVSGVADGDAVAVSVQAIEMVYSPQGAFWVGDGSATGNAFNAGIVAGAPFQVTSEGAITLGGILAANLCAQNNGVDDFDNSTLQTLPAAFPKGYQAFYAMKYEITMGQYTDFLNKQTPTQAAARFPNQSGNIGHTITNTGTAPTIYATTTPDRGCNYLDLIDLFAYADWAALRPLTELEYEKLCRGNRPVVSGEFAWGTAFIRGTTLYTYANEGSPNETATNPETGLLGNAHYAIGTFRPLRVGLFAASVVTPTRANAGAGYSGAMELTGNLTEPCIWVGNTPGRAFTGVMGDGNLSTAGAANVTAWSAIVTVKVKGAGFGTFQPTSVSDRMATGTSAQFENSGGRLCRTP